MSKKYLTRIHFFQSQRAMDKFMKSGRVMTYLSPNSSHIFIPSITYWNMKEFQNYWLYGETKRLGVFEILRMKWFGKPFKWEHRHAYTSH